MTKMIRITARPANGFRRCGVHHPAEAIDHPADTFNAKQRAILEAEPQLIVQEIEVVEKPASKSEDGKSAKTNKNNT